MKQRGLLVLYLLIAGILILVLRYEPGLTGGAVYQNYTWHLDFSAPSAYIYDSSLLSFQPEGVSLLPFWKEITVATATVSKNHQRIKEQGYPEVEKDNNDSNGDTDGKDGGDNDDKESEENEDKEEHEDTLPSVDLLLARDDKVLHLQKKKDLSLGFQAAGNLFSFYVTADKAVTLYLCSQQPCEDPDLGKMEISGESGWYNLTVEQQTSFVVLHSTSSLTIDAVKLYQQAYHSSATLQTLDLPREPGTWWQSFYAEQELHGQQIDYAYSVDNGLSWLELPSNFSNFTHLRLQVTLLSDGTASPVLTAMGLHYSVHRCEENWTISRGICLSHNTQLVWYEDLHACGTKIHLPADNGTYQDCDYCAAHNCTKVHYFESGNSTLHLPGLIRLETNSSFRQPITITEYDSSKLPTPSEYVALNQVVDIQASPEIGLTIITWYYQDQDLLHNHIAEDTLRIYYYNEISAAWERLLSTHNADENYLSATISHFSLYGLFGQSASTPSSGSGLNDGSIGVSGGGGGSGSGRGEIASSKSPPSVQETLPLLTTSARQTPSLAPQRGCDYVLEMSLPQRISFLQDDSYQGDIINKGNCAVQHLNLLLAPELAAVVELSPSSITSLDVGQNSTFTLIRRSKSSEDWLSFLTGTAIAQQLITQDISGMVTLESKENDIPLFRKEIPLEIEILSPEKIVNSAKMISPGMLLIVVMLMFMFVRRRKKQQLLVLMGKKRR